MKHILKCEKCDLYTMKEACPVCNSKTLIVRPAKWNPDDQYGAYRREARRSLLQEKGLL